MRASCIEITSKTSDFVRKDVYEFREIIRKI